MKETLKKIGKGAVALSFLAIFGLGLVTAPAMAAPSDECDTSSGIGGGINCAHGENTPSDMTGASGIVNTVINTMLFIVGILSVIMIIFAGIRYVTAHGDKGQVESAKNTLIYAIVGLIIAIVAYALVNWVANLFGSGSGSSS